MKKIFRVIAVILCISMLFLSGCAAAPAATDTTIGETGLLILRVNPEIEIAYDKDGKVLSLTGKNEDGKRIVSAMQDYTGKSCDSVLQDLIMEIDKAGYFAGEIDGQQKNIVLQIEPGSVLPSDHFLTDMSTCTQEAVKGLSLTSGIVTIGKSDYDPAYDTQSQSSSYITLEKAKEIALAQANVSKEDAVFSDKDFDFEKGNPIFELEFYANGMEYEYDVHAVTGDVLKAQHEVVTEPWANQAAGADNGATYSDAAYGNVSSQSSGTAGSSQNGNAGGYRTTDYTDYTNYTNYTDDTDYRR